MVKFGFNIKTKTGHKVDNIMIMARDIDEAERRLRQMYQQCQILGSHESSNESRRQSLDVDSVIGLISRHAAVHHKPGTH
jgi:hypothetical protein